MFPDLLKGMLPFPPKPETQHDDAALTWSQYFKQLLQVAVEILLQRGLDR